MWKRTVMFLAPVLVCAGIYPGQGKSIVYTRVFEIKKVSVPLGMTEELKRFYRVIGGDERSTAVLKPAGK